MRVYFPRLLGNADTARRLGRAIEDGTLSHAFLISGPSGSGKDVLAREIAAAVNCENLHGDGQLPCTVCSACKRIYADAFPDVKILKKPQDRATLGVDPVKDLREDMFLSSTESEKKVYIIDDAECMTPEAQNALLKVLEEPPSNVIIILLARESDKILTTIKSRAQYITMSRFTDSEVERILPTLSEDAARLAREDKSKFASVVVSADGRLGEGVRLSSKKNADECNAQRAEVLDLLRALKQGSSAADVYAATTALQSTRRQELLFSLENVITALRDLIAVQMSGEVRLLFFTSRDEALALAREIGTRRLLSAYDATVTAHGYCSRNANTTNVLAGLLASLATRN